MGARAATLRSEADGGEGVAGLDEFGGAVCLDGGVHVGGGAVEHLIDHALAGNVLDLTAAEVMLVGESQGISFAQRWDVAAPDEFAHISRWLLEEDLVDEAALER